MNHSKTQRLNIDITTTYLVDQKSTGSFGVPGRGYEVLSASDWAVSVALMVTAGPCATDSALLLASGTRRFIHSVFLGQPTRVRGSKE